MFSTTRQHLRCTLLFDLIGHFVLLIDVYISFFVSAINVAHSLYRGLSLVWQSSGLLVLCCNSSLRDFVGGSKVFCCQLLKLSSWKCMTQFVHIHTCVYQYTCACNWKSIYILIISFTVGCKEREGFASSDTGNTLKIKQDEILLCRLCFALLLWA